MGATTTARFRRHAALALALALGVAAALALAAIPTPAPAAQPSPGPPALCRTTGPGGGAGAGRACAPWRARDQWAGAPAPLYTTVFTAQPGVPAYAAWIRTSAVDLALYLGYEGPGPTALPRGPEAVPASGLPRLLATFNSGFYEKDAAEGFYVNHTLYFPMVDGQATVERFSNGRVDIVRWTGGARPPDTVVMARQNLPLLVNAGAATPLSADDAAWGLTLHGAPAVWRSALGIDAGGNLVYAAAPDQTGASLAALMVRLGCVRAMELDINPEWPVFVTYAGPGARGPDLAVANPNQIPTRFLTVTTKDFFAVFASRRPGEPQPW